MAGITNVDGDPRPRQIVRDQPSPATNLPLDTSKALALVGSFPYLEPAVPAVVTSSAAMKRLDPLDAELQLMERLIYDCAPTEPAVSRNPAAVVLVNASPSTQASVTLLDANGDDSLVVSSQLWGAVGNRVTAAVASGTTQGKKYTFTAPSPLESVIVDNVGGTNIITVTYSNSGQATTMLAAFDPTTGLRLSYTKTAIALGTLTVTTLAFDGQITFTPSVGAGVGETFSCVITGTNKATNAPDTETVTFANADGTTPKTSTKYWSAVSTIVFSATAGTPTFTIAGYAFDLPPTPTGLSAGYPTAQSLAVKIGSALGFTAAITSTTAASTPTEYMDAVSSTTCKNVVVGLPANLYAAEVALAGIGLVTVERATGATLPPANVSTTYLGGAVDGTETTDSWTDALAALTTITYTGFDLWLDTDSATYQALGLAHVTAMSKKGGYARQMWVGATASESLSALQTRVLAFNSRNVTLWFQEFQRTNQAGATVWLAPKYLALEAAAMQCQMAAGSALTYKHPKMTAVRCNAAIVPADDGTTLINSGLCYALKGADGTFLFERPVTTYGVGDNVFWTAPGSVESYNMLLNAVNTFVASQRVIGARNVDFTKLKFKSLCSIALNKAVEPNTRLIVAWSASSLIITVDGGYYIANFDVEPIRDVLFVEFRPTTTTIPATITAAA